MAGGGSLRLIRITQQPGAIFTPLRELGVNLRANLITLGNIEMGHLPEFLLRVSLPQRAMARSRSRP